MSRININILAHKLFIEAVSYARTLAIVSISGFSECTMGRDDILPVIEVVRQAVLSPDDLLGYNLLFVRSHFSCRSMPSNNNFSLTQVHFTKLHQENPIASSLTVVRKIGRLTWFSCQSSSARLCILGTSFVEVAPNHLLYRSFSSFFNKLECDFGTTFVMSPGHTSLYIGIHRDETRRYSRKRCNKTFGLGADIHFLCRKKCETLTGHLLAVSIIPLLRF